jgi:hypothetical protein
LHPSACLSRKQINALYFSSLNDLPLLHSVDQKSLSPCFDCNDLEFKKHGNEMSCKSAHLLLQKWVEKRKFLSVNKNACTINLLHIYAKLSPLLLQTILFAREILSSLAQKCTHFFAKNAFFVVQIFGPFWRQKKEILMKTEFCILCKKSA